MIAAPRQTPQVCVIGAGPAGLTACKNLLQRGLTVECFEKRADLGGLWNLEAGRSAAYPGVSMISSKRLSAFVDHPLPAGVPPYPSQNEALAYLRSYADRFQLRPHIRFESEVTSVDAEESGWTVRLAGASEARHYRALVVANGHHWHPRLPAWVDQFSGQWLHAFDYERAEDFAGQRVLVVGGGNTGSDVAVAISRHAVYTALSLRRGYHILPKFLLGAPIDRCGERLSRWGLPWFMYRTIVRGLLHVAVGPPSRYGLPMPDHRLLEAHPTINSELLHQVAHRRIDVKPDVVAIDASRVRFQDASREAFDTIICATGYEARFPFLSQSELIADLYYRAFHRQRNDFFVIGLIQPNGAIWPLADYQAQLAARVLERHLQSEPLPAWFERARKGGNYRPPFKYVDSDRHGLEVEYFSYERELRRMIRRFGRASQAA